jgi:hypothetical protein
MFGYFDPATLTVGRRSAEIEFVNASDAADVRRIPIRSAEEARRIHRALDAQKSMRIASLDGDMMEVGGIVRMNPSHPDEGIMTTSGSPSRTLPIKLAFDIGRGDIPEKAFAIVHGREEAGALVVCRMAMRPVSPGPRPASGPAAEERAA